MTIRLLGPDTSGWTLADPSGSGGINGASGYACWFSTSQVSYTATATGNITEAYVNMFTWSSATSAHMYLYDNGGNLLGGTHTNGGSGFSSAGGTGANLTATGFTPISVTSGSQYINVLQPNTSSQWRPNGQSGGSTHVISYKAPAVMVFGNPPATLPAQDGTLGGVLELATWWQGTTGPAVTSYLMYHQRKVLYFI